MGVAVSSESIGSSETLSAFIRIGVFGALSRYFEGYVTAASATLSAIRLRDVDG